MWLLEPSLWCDLHLLIFLAPGLGAAATLGSGSCWNGLFLEGQGVNSSTQHLMLPCPGALQSKQPPLGWCNPPVCPAAAPGMTLGSFGLFEPVAQAGAPSPGCPHTRSLPHCSLPPWSKPALGFVTLCRRCQGGRCVLGQHQELPLRRQSSGLTRVGTGGGFGTEGWG